MLFFTYLASGENLVPLSVLIILILIVPLTKLTSFARKSKIIVTMALNVCTENISGGELSQCRHHGISGVSCIKFPQCIYNLNIIASAQLIKLIDSFSLRFWLRSKGVNTEES